MTGRLGRRSGAAAAAVTALLTLVPSAASRAGAADGGPVITLDQPAAASTSASSTVTIAGSASTDLPIYQMKEVVLSVGGQTSPVTTCTGNAACPFSWKATLASNGPYTVTAKATETAILLGTPLTTTQTRSFSVDAPPAKPVLDPPTVTDTRTVQLSWSRNTEPDMLYYAVFRKDPAGTKFLQVGSKVVQPPSGKSVLFTDTTTTFNGGDFTYQVVAVRKGATADTEKSSDPSTAATASVPPPPTSTTVTVPGGSTGPGTTAKPGPPAGVDLNGFLDTRSAPISVPPITTPDPPDPGFQSTLPFGARPAAGDVEDGSGDPAAVAPANRSTSVVSSGVSGRPLVPVAAGLILLMLAMHMRILNRRLKPVAEGDLPVDLPVPPVGPPSRRRAGKDRAPEALAAHPPPAPRTVRAVRASTPEPDPEPEPLPPPLPQFYDVLQEEAWGAEPAPAPDPDATAMMAMAVDPDPADADVDGSSDDDWMADADLEPELAASSDRRGDRRAVPGPEPEPVRARRPRSADPT
ncbi:MAG TPA: hypothetical protein VHT97_06720, partial [Acidimicrobiales bacterium]|nr:hypothetical protein [Acidimicrobiales bacterium]